MGKIMDYIKCEEPWGTTYMGMTPSHWVISIVIVIAALPVVILLAR